MPTDSHAAGQSQTVPSTVDIELLALDVESCTRCRGTRDHIQEAIRIVHPVLEVLATRVNVSTIIIESEAQARRHRLVASPTIRVNGADIALETVESECESCTDLCCCDEGTSCRVWRYRGGEYEEAPVGLVVESILREMLGGGRGGNDTTPAYAGVPENLRRFFAARAKAGSAADECCPPAERKSCCEPEEKAACCDALQPETCSCR